MNAADIARRLGDTIDTLRADLARVTQRAEAAEAKLAEADAALAELGQRCHKTEEQNKAAIKTMTSNYDDSEQAAYDLEVAREDAHQEEEVVKMLGMLKEAIAAGTPGPVSMWSGRGWPKGWGVPDATIVWPIAPVTASTDEQYAAATLSKEDQRMLWLLWNNAATLIAMAEQCVELKGALAKATGHILELGEISQKNWERAESLEARLTEVRAVRDDLLTMQRGNVETNLLRNSLAARLGHIIANAAQDNGREKEPT